VKRFLYICIVSSIFARNYGFFVEQSQSAATNTRVANTRAANASAADTGAANSFSYACSFASVRFFLFSLFLATFGWCRSRFTL
jgi:hypothetical protein